MPKVYLVKGDTRDYEESETWVHSAFLDGVKAKAKLNELQAFIKSLPPKPDWTGGKATLEEYLAWKENCKKRLNKKDRKSSFYGFGASYSIEAIDISE